MSYNQILKLAEKFEKVSQQQSSEEELSIIANKVIGEHQKNTYNFNDIEGCLKNLRYSFKKLQSSTTKEDKARFIGDMLMYLGSIKNSANSIPVNYNLSEDERSIVNASRPEERGEHPL